MLSSRDHLPSSRKADGGHPPHSSREAMAVAINYLIWGAALLFGASSYSSLLFSILGAAPPHPCHRHLQEVNVAPKLNRHLDLV